jgi:hypothetical protein
LRKVYINVTATYTKDGTLLPIYFLWEDGIKYNALSPYIESPTCKFDWIDQFAVFVVS